MSIELNAEDPGPESVSSAQVRRTLAKLREDPARGRAIVCEVEGAVAGYALLISFWSNELGGEVCTLDEVFVVAKRRGRGLTTALLERLAAGDKSVWPSQPAALTLEVSAHNQRARIL
jgi:GNAT superfamily N-acetyltransferase